jgi:hypothetical protein
MGLMSRKKILRSLVIVVVAILLFWIGGYTFFVNSEELVSIKSVITETDVVTTRVGKVNEITTSLFGFSYSFSGKWAHTDLRLTVTGEKGVAQFQVELEKSDGSWRIIQIKAV